jgi:hypothetical protein
MTHIEEQNITFGYLNYFLNPLSLRVMLMDEQGELEKKQIKKRVIENRGKEIIIDYKKLKEREKLRNN